MSFPYPTEPEENPNQNGQNIDESAHYPKFSKVHKYPNPYKIIGQRINTAPNQKEYEQNIKPKIKPKTNPKNYPKIAPKVNPKVYPKANPKAYPKAYPKENPYPESYPEGYPEEYPKNYPKEIQKGHKHVHTHTHKKKVKKIAVPVTKYVAVPVGPPMLMPVITEGTMAVYPNQAQQAYQYAPYGTNTYDYNYGTGANYVVMPQGYQTNYDYGGYYNYGY